MSSEINNGGFLPDTVGYVNIFDRSELTDTQDQAVASELDDLAVLRDALRVANTNSLIDREPISFDTRFPAPQGFPQALIEPDGTTSLSDVANWLTSRGTSPYASTGVLAAFNGATASSAISSSAIAEQIGALENEIGRLRSTRAQGAEAGLSVINGTFYVDGKVVSLPDLLVAIRLNRAHNAHTLVNQLTEDIEARQKLIEAATDLQYAIRSFTPAETDSKLWFVENDGLGKDVRIGKLDNGDEKSLAQVINAIQEKHGLDTNPLNLFAGTEQVTHTFYAYDDNVNNGTNTGVEPYGTRWVGGYWKYGTLDKTGSDNTGINGHWINAKELRDIGFTVTRESSRGGERQWTPPAGDSTSNTTVNDIDATRYRYTFKGPSWGDPQILNQNRLSQWNNRINNEVQQINSQQDIDNLTLDNQNKLFYDQLTALTKSDDREQDSNLTIAENI